MAKSMSQQRKKKIAFYSICMAIPLACFILFYVVVNFRSFLMAFQTYDISTAEWNWDFTVNFKRLFDDLGSGDGILLIAFKNSLIEFLCQVFIGMSLILIFSYFISKTKGAGKFFRVILFIPGIISSVVLVEIFRIVTEIGLPQILNSLDSAGGHVGPLSNPDTVFGTVVFYTLWVGFGGMVLVFSSAFSRIPASIVESAKLDGISDFKEFIFISLPLIFPTISTYLVMYVVGLFVDQANLFTFFAKNAEVQDYTIGYYLFSMVKPDENTTPANYPYASALGLVFTAIAVPTTLLLRKLFNKFDPEVEF